MRLIMGLLAGQENHHFILTGDKSLRNRPMKRVGQPLKMMGAKVSGRCGGDLAPLSIIGSKLRGAVIGTPVASAQIKSTQSSLLLLMQKVQLLLLNQQDQEIIAREC